MIDARAFDGVVNLFFVMAIACVIFIPLGLWKLVELIIWVTRHIKFI
jgi:hypothetical protein